VEEGDTVSIHLTNLERAEDEVHGFAMYGNNVQLSIEPGKTASTTFVADRTGVFPYYCTEFCSALHLEMQGYLLVKPKGYQATTATLKEGTTYTEADYRKQVETNIATQGVIDQVVTFITSHNYKDFATVVALVEDATDQLGFAEEAKKKSEDAAGKKDWSNAMLPGQDRRSRSARENLPRGKWRHQGQVVPVVTMAGGDVSASPPAQPETWPFGLSAIREDSI
jgi:nitrous-oxide reductase